MFYDMALGVGYAWVISLIFKLFMGHQAKSDATSTPYQWPADNNLTQLNDIAQSRFQQF